MRTGGDWRILVHHAGIFDSAEDSDAEEDDETDDRQLAIWEHAAHPGAGIRAEEGDDDAPGELDPHRPPPGRLH